MKTSELRIGSWVIVKPFTQTVGNTTMSQEHPQICQITCIQKVGDSAVVQVNDNIIVPIPIEHIMGIPLSEKILNKGGFLQSHNDRGSTFHVMEDNGFVVKYTIEHWTKTTVDKYKNRFHADKIGKIEFVHQVQDILFTLLKMDFDFSFLRSADVTMHFEEGNPEPIAMNIKISDDN